MTKAFTRPALVCNTRSGSHDETMRAAIEEACRAAGAPLAATFALPDASLPDAQMLRAQDIDLLLVWTGDVLRHGLAWLGGDFRDGPSEPIATAETILLESAAPISLEYDGELSEISSPARFALGMSAVDFLTTA